MAEQSKLKIMNLKTDDSGKNAELTLYGDIGDSFWEDISSKRLVQELETLDVENITLNISSNGGGTTAAIAIANALKRHKARVIANIDGIVASAATIITSACDVVRMPKNALFMIHNPWTIAMGEEKDFEKMAETLSKVKNSIIETYIDKTGIDRNKLSELMDKESWFSANEAKEYGFIDEIIENTDMEIIGNKILSHGLVFNMTKFKNFKISNNSNVNNKNKEEVIVNEKEFMEKYPDLYDEIVNKAKETGKTEERNRIEELENFGVDSEIITKAKFKEPKNLSEIALDLANEMKNKMSEPAGNIPEPTSKDEDYRNQNPPLGTVPNNGAEKTQAEKDKEEADKILAFANKGGIK